jgi:hypothetical protein
MNEFNLPIILKKSIGSILFDFFGMFFFIVLAILSSIYAHANVAICFVPFILLGILNFILSQTSIEVDKDSITLHSPPFGVYQINFSEVQYIEIGGQTIAFFGRNKRLVITLAFVSRKRLPEFFYFINKFAEDTNIPISSISSVWPLMQKNTKILNKYF